MKTAVIYARYSSDRQTEQSIEGQLRVCNEYAERNNILVIDTYIDRAMTGTNDRRTSFQQMLKDSSKGAWDYVIVYKIDRFGRNKYEIAMNKHTLKLNGIRLLSAMENIPDTPEGIILESLLEGMAEYYSAELSQKVKRGMNESRLKGQYTGGFVLYGYKIKDKKIVVDEDTAAVVRLIFEQYSQGVYVKDIISGLTERGILNRGKPFAKNTIHHMLRNEKYIGIYRHNDEVFTNIYPPIVPQELFNAVKEKIDDNKYGKRSPDVTYLLRNKVRCGICGSPIFGELAISKNKNKIRYYTCTKRKKCQCEKTRMRKEILEKLVIDETVEVLSQNEILSKLADLVLQRLQARIKANSIMNILQEKNARLQSAIENIMNAMEQGIITASTKERLLKLEEERTEVLANIAMENAKEQITLTKEEIIKFIQKSINKSPQSMISLLIREIVLYDDKIEIYYNYTNNPVANEPQGIIFYTKEVSINVYSFGTCETHVLELKIVLLV